MIYWEPLTRDNLPILCVYMFGVIWIYIYFRNLRNIVLYALEETYIINFMIYIYICKYML